MPKFLSPEEVQQVRRTLRSQTIEPYAEYLRSLQPGEYGAVQLERNETQRTIKRRLTTASREVGRNIRYRRSRDGLIIFEVVS